MIDRSAEQEAAYDRLDDQGQLDAATIREMTGYDTDGSNEDFTAEAITARTGNIALSSETNDPRQKWIESFHLSQPSSEGPIRHATSQERHNTSQQIDKIRKIIRPHTDEA